MIDDLTVRQAFRASLHVLMNRPGASLGITAVWLTFSYVLAESLGPSFDSGATPLTLTALAVGKNSAMLPRWSTNMTNSSP